MRAGSIAIAVCVGLVAAGGASGQTPGRAAGTSDPASLTPGPGFDFELAPPAAKTAALDPQQAAALDRRVRLRRGMLVAHQAFGFATLALLAATAVVGTLSYADKYGGGPDDGRYETSHLGLASSATATFAVTGMLALLAPNPYPKPVRADAALVHKLSMALAAACFTAQLVLGPVAASRDGSLGQRSLAEAHVGLGWGALAFMGAGTLAYVLR
jgi:hypothetical protein